MTLRGKTLLIIAASLVSLLLTVALVSRLVLLTRFAALEEQETRQNVERGVSAVSEGLADLGDLAKDYGAWDMTYEYMATRDPVFVRANLPTAADTSLNVQFVALLDLSGDVVSGRALDRVRRVNTPLPASLAAYLSAHKVLAAPHDSAQGMMGVAPLPEAPALLASWPILTTEGHGPARGTLVLGRSLDAGEVGRLARRTHLALRIYALSDPEIAWARPTLLGGAPAVVQRTSADSISGYALLKDPLGEPSVVLRVDMPRHIYTQSKASLAYLLVALLLVGLVFGAVTLGLLEGTLLTRISRLSASVSQIGARPHLPARVAMSGGDELSSLAEAVNGMLGALQKSQAKLKDILEHSSNLFFSHAPDHTFTYVSPQTRAFFDCEPEEALVKWTDFTTDNPANNRGLARTIRAIETGEPQEPHELELVREAPVVRDGRTVAIVGAFADITERKRAEKLQSAAYRIAHVTSSLDDMHDFYRAIQAIVDELLYAKNFRIALCEAGSETLSPAYDVTEPGSPARTLLERGLEERVQRTGKPLLAPRPVSAPLAEVHETLGDWLGVPLMHGDTCFGVLSIWSGAGGLHLSETDQSLLTFVSQHVATAIEHKRAQEQIKSLAYNDALTGLPNRAVFNDRLTVALAQAHRQGQRLSVLFLDLDHFKVINDSLGHTVGDRLLQGVAGRLLASGREGDTVARLGGDEFTLLLPGIAQAVDVAKVAEKILSTIRQPFRLDEHELFVTASIGISLYPDDGLDAETLVKNADVSMYRAKELGRDTYQLYTAAMNATALERLNLENHLRKALAHDELLVYYQPLMRVGSTEIYGFEALLRWNHPERGLILPSEFVPLAEITGLIVPIGPWILRRACAQAKAWHEGGNPMKVAVNLSARQLQQPGLFDQVKDILEETGLEPRFLGIEITETNAMQNAEATIPTLRRLKSLGVGISIDDFGIGYSSLSYLRRLPIDTIKIDQSFVRDLTSDPDDAAIASAVIAMAHTLKLLVVAEGVETEDQMAFLMAHGCDLAQGDFFSPAVPPEECEEFLLKSR
jgi:diguanylate cyclase (GGDEF)-like protein